GFLRPTPATTPATSNQFTPPESQNNLYAPPGGNAAPPVGAYPGYQSSVDPSRADGRRLASGSSPQFRRAGTTTQVSNGNGTAAASGTSADVQLAGKDASFASQSSPSGSFTDGNVTPASHTTE